MDDVTIGNSRQRAQQQTRDALFKAARDLVVEKGLEALSITEVAARAGFTKGAFYSNFTSRDDLILHLVRAGHSRQSTTLGALPALASSAGIAAALDEYAGIAAAHIQSPRRATLVAEVQLLASRNHSAAAEIHSGTNRIWDELARVIKALADIAGVKLPLQPRQVARSLLGLTQGLSQQPGDCNDARAIMRAYLRLLFKA